MRRVVILGGGFAGVAVAKRLAALLRRDHKWHILLIDKNTYHTYTPYLYEVATGYAQESKVFGENAGEVVALSLREILQERNIIAVEDEVTAIDLSSKRVSTKGGVKIPFDYAVIALGAETSFFNVPGAAEFALPLKNFKDAMRIRERLRNLVKSAAKTKKHIVVAGGGYTGVEVAAELNCCLRRLCKDCGVTRENLQITILEGGDDILPGAPSKLRELVKYRLLNLGVDIKPQSRVGRVGENYVETVSSERIPADPVVETRTSPPPAGGGDEGNHSSFHYRADLVIWAGGITAPQVIAAIPNAEHDERGRLYVDSFLRVKGRNDVFALGDNAIFTDEKSSANAPGTASIAVRQAPVVACNIAALIKKNPLKKYTLSFPGFVVPVGGKYIVASLSGVTFGGILAGLLHQFIAFKYYASVLSFPRALWLMVSGARLFSRND